MLTRPLAVKYFNKERQKTNAESLIGEQALVTEDIDTLQAAGHVEIRGEEWSGEDRRSRMGKIAKDTIVVVEGIQGVKLIVRERRKEEE